MKIISIITAVALFLSGLSAFSQEENYKGDQILSFAPLGIVNKMRVKYEVAVRPVYTVGSFFNYYYGNFKGIKCEPFIRYYPAKGSPEGLYFQMKAHFGFYSSDIDYHYNAPLDTLEVSRNVNYFALGFGYGCGYQYYNRKGKAIDLFFGMQYSNRGFSDTYLSDGILYNTYDDFWWFLTGPGSYLNMHIGIGLVF